MVGFDRSCNDYSAAAEEEESYDTAAGPGPGSPRSSAVMVCQKSARGKRNSIEKKRRSVRLTDTAEAAEGRSLAAGTAAGDKRRTAAGQSREDSMTFREGI